MQTKRLLEKRSTTHGAYKENARGAQAIKSAMRAERRWSELSDVQKESLEMIATKIGRILAGNPSEKDHWDDIAGYATLVSNYIAQK